jgi:hypothetical protein
MNHPRYSVLNVDQFKREQKTSQLASILGDNLGRVIITEIMQEKSLAVSDLPLKDFTSMDALLRLYQFQEMGLLKSKFENRKENYERIFYPTPLMSEVSKHMGEIPYSV